VTPPVLIAPSILAADFARLGEEVAAIEAHVDMLHIDIMDGHFVPNISIGIPVVESLRRVSGLKFDCHMMTTNPAPYFEALAGAGANLVTVHIEAYPDPTEAAAEARRVGLEFGVVMNPPTPFAAIEPFVELADLVLVMSVHPGFGGQSFIEDVLPKVEATRKFVEKHALTTDIEIDGGISPSTVSRARTAGANVFVAGSAIFSTDDAVAAVHTLRDAAEAKGSS